MKQTFYYEIRVAPLQYIGAYNAQNRTLILTVKVAILATIVPCCVSRFPMPRSAARAPDQGNLVRYEAYVQTLSVGDTADLYAVRTISSDWPIS
jgi:hypothetical protein